MPLLWRSSRSRSALRPDLIFMSEDTENTEDKKVHMNLCVLRGLCGESWNQ